MELLSIGHPSVSYQAVPTSLQAKLEHTKNSSVIFCSLSRYNHHRSQFCGVQCSNKASQKEGLKSLKEKLCNGSALHTDKRRFSLTTDENIGHRSSILKKTDEVMIPNLPDDSDRTNPAAQITSCFWEWKPKLVVHYEKAGTENVGQPAILFLPGFGVGTFHYEKQLKDLGRDFRVWTLDFLGQGKSLPFEDPAPADKQEGDSSDKTAQVWGFGKESEPWAKELAYSIDLWHDQVRDFIQQVIGEPVYVVGNSLGGYVALYFAACNPQLVKGVTLLNATPFWGFLPNPTKSPRLSKLFPWAGTFPLPARLRKLGEFLWEKISEPSSIREVLKQVYADHSMKVDKVYSKIVETTQHPAAAAAFISIMFAPQAKMTFNEALDRCKQQGVPLCLMYGKEDPWVRPVWGLRVKQKLPEIPYYEISPAGHCPHDEVPEVVNFLLRGWIKALQSQGSVSLPLLDELDYDQYDSIAKDLEYTRGGLKQTVQVRFIGPKFSIWNKISSFLQSRIQSNKKLM